MVLSLKKNNKERKRERKETAVGKWARVEGRGILREGVGLRKEEEKRITGEANLKLSTTFRQLKFLL